MRPEIQREIDDAQDQGLGYTPFRRVYDLAERGTDQRCACGEPALYVSYCTLDPSERSLACQACFQKAAIVRHQ